MKKISILFILILIACMVLQSCGKPAKNSKNSSDSEITSADQSGMSMNGSSAGSIDASGSSVESGIPGSEKSDIGSDGNSSNATPFSGASSLLSSSSAAPVDILKMPLTVTKIYSGDTKTERVWINAGPVENKLKNTKMTFFIDNGVLKYYYDNKTPINTHADIIFSTTPDTEYIIRAKVKGDNKSALLLCKIPDWSTIAYNMFKNTSDWVDIWMTFNSGDNSQVRLCWYGGNNGTMYQSAAGTAWIKEVVVEKNIGNNIPEAIAMIYPDKITGKVLKEIFGYHMSYFNESATLRNKSNYFPMLNELGPGLLRFPGGEESDNYLWDTKQVYRTDWFHSQYDSLDLDTDGYFEICRKTGAQPYIVLNYDYGNDSDSEAERNDRLFKYNQDWAKYIKKKGYSIRYFEFGNEAIYASDKFGTEITPEQYAADYLKMRKLLKEVDPGYELGANMYNHYDGEGWSVSSRDWADTFFTIVGKNCDFVTPHLYYEQGVRGGFTSTRYGLDEVVQDFKTKTLAKTGKAVEVIMSEWNLWINNESIRLGNFGHGLVLADGIFGLAKGGAKGSCVWPLHWGVGAANNYTYFYDVQYGLQKDTDNSLTTAGYVFSQLSKEMRGYDIIRMDMQTENNSLSHIALKSADGTRMKILIANYSLKDKAGLRLKLNSGNIRNVTTKMLVSNNKDLKSDSTASSVAGKVIFDKTSIKISVEPYSIAIIQCDISN